MFKTRVRLAGPKLAAANLRATAVLAQHQTALAQLEAIISKGRASLADLEAVLALLQPGTPAYRLMEDAIGCGHHVSRGGSGSVFSILHGVRQAMHID